MKKGLLVVVIVLVGGAWLMGYWPQRQRIAALGAELQASRQRAETAEAQARTGALLAELGNIEEAVLRQNYGDAQQMALTFFQHVREEAARAATPAVRQALEAVGQRRDAITSALARADASVLSALRETESALRQAFGFSVYGPHPAIPGGVPPPASSPSPFPAGPLGGSPLPPPLPTPTPAAPLGLPSP